ncbi:MAG: hypothetical protein ACKOYN_03450 [Planctomycetota bacterium]
MLALPMLILAAAGWLAPLSAHAQTLALDGVPAGPEIPEKNAATGLAEQLEAESAEFERLATQRTHEAKAIAGARHKFRAIAAYLLRTGGAKPWNDSASVVAGARLAGAMGRIDAVLEAAAAGKRVGAEVALTAAQSGAARAALERLAAASLDTLRSAASSSPDVSAERIAAALSALLAPLAELGAVTEAELPHSAWPVVTDARAAQLERTDALIDLASLRTRAAAIGDAPLRDALARAIDTAAARIAKSETQAQAGSDLLADATEAVESLAARLASPPPHVVDPAALAVATRRVAEQLAAAFRAPVPGADTDQDARIEREARERLSATVLRIEAAEAMAKARSDFEKGEVARRELSEGATALYRDELPAGATPKSALRAARRIVEACRAWRDLEEGEGREPPRDLKETVRALDRSGRVAMRAVPAALARLAQDPLLIADPGVGSALARVDEIRAIREDMIALQSMVDAVSGIRPAAGRGFAAAARRLARMLLDPVRKGDAQAAFDSLEAQFARSIPLAYEEELRAQTDRAIRLTGGKCRDLLDAAAEARAAWADALSRGDFGGDAAQQMDRIARLCACLRDLDRMDQPVTREQGDRLAMWGGWATRRAALAPAAQDLATRAALAVGGLVSRGGADAKAAFRRDLDALEQSIPLVRLASQLEARIGPLMTGPSESMGALLSPIISVPTRDAFLVREWPRLLALDRALLEAEFARSSGAGALRESLSKYTAALALDIERSAFGSVAAVSPLKGFTGTEDGDRPPASGSGGTRPRERNPRP